MALKTSQREKLKMLASVDDEGLEYTFLHYSSFPDIKDNEFHEKREAFVKAAKELKAYIEGMV